MIIRSSKYYLHAELCEIICLFHCTSVLRVRNEKCAVNGSKYETNKQEYSFPEGSFAWK